MILVVDLEANCAEDGSIPAADMEIIELGAVWATYDGKVINSLQRFVRPIERSCLTEFCIELTRIEQSQVDAASEWRLVAVELAEFARLYDVKLWGSWGNYDAHQIERECARQDLSNPLTGFVHVNLKAAFAKKRRIKQVGMAMALKIVGLELHGEHHRALSDAHNIASLLPYISPIQG